jgi:TolB-like protein/tetratricopeptide (TPR) repeat protein
MSLDRIIARVKSGRVLPVVAVYLAGGWIALQVVATLNDLISLPGWIGPAALTLLGIGLVIVTATAWVQANPAMDEKEASGAVPGDWEIAPGDLLRSLRSGRMPHLNWARAFGGGLVAIALLVGVATGYALAGSRVRASLLASEAGMGVAVLPFHASGAGVDVGLGEGMMDLIAANIDAIVGLRAISPRAVVVRLEDGTTDVDALHLARELGASYAVTGRITGVGSRLRVVIEIRDAATGRRLGEPLHADGSADDLLQLSDQLSVQIASAMLQADPEFAQGFRPSLSLTSSPTALRAFLDGEAEFRRMELTRAAAAYRRAVEADSTFALAWARTAALLGWVTPGSREILVAVDNALRERARLPERDRFFIEGFKAYVEVDPLGLSALRNAVGRYPDDALLWNVLGEFHVHNGHHFLAPMREAYDAFLTAVRLEPGFVPHYIHAIEMSVLFDDTATSRALITAQGSRLDTEEVRGLLISHGLAFTAGERWVSARAALDTIHDTGTSIEIPLSLPRLLPLKDHFTALRRERQPNARNARIRVMTLATRGRLAEAVARLDDELLTGADRGKHALLLLTLGAPEPAAGWDAYMAIEHSDTTLSTYMFVSGAYAAERGDWSAHERALGLMRRMEEVRTKAHDTVALNVIRKRRLVTEAFGALKQSRFDDARQLFDAAAPLNQDLISGLAREWLGELAFAQGRDAEALRYFESLRRWDSDTNEHPLRHLRIARLHERANRTAEARAAIEEFLLIWKDADPGHPALLEAATALDRLH